MKAHRRNGFTTTPREIQIAEQTACLLDCLPPNVARQAIASCYFVIQSPNSVGINARNWGKWVRTCIFAPGGDIPLRAHVWHRSGNWLRGDSAAAANAILAYFGVTIEDVKQRYGEPVEGSKYKVRLSTIIADMIPDLLPANLVNVA